MKISSIGDEVRKLEGALADATAALNTARAQDKAARVAEVALNEEAGRVADKMRKARDRVQAEQAVAAATAIDMQARGALERCQQALRAAEGEAVLAAEHLTHLIGEHDAIAIRARLAIGEPCPVCLHPIQEIPASPADIQSSITSARANADAARKRERSMQTRVNEAESEARAALRMLEEATKTLKHLADASALPAVEAELTALNERCAKIQADSVAAEKAVENGHALHREFAANLAREQGRLQGLTRERDNVQIRLHTAQERLEAAFPAKLPGDVAHGVAQRRSDLLAARQAETIARTKCDQARQTHGEIARSCEQLNRQETLLMKDCAQQRGTLSE